MKKYKKKNFKYSINQKIGCFYIKERSVETIYEKQYLIYTCECSCGSIVKKKQRYLNKKCICTCNHEKDDAEFRKWNSYFNTYICSSEQRQIKFNLNINQFINICKKNCVYCGSEPIFRKKYKINANGIDRVHNDTHYYMDNCQPCCPMCNKMKGSYSKSDFLSQCFKVSKHKKHKL